MKLCNDTITVVNKKWDAEAGYDVYYPTVISGVSWYGEIVSNVGDKGLNAANRFTVRIPADADFGGKTYVDPITYENTGNVTEVFTLSNGDRMVKGVIETVTKPADLDNSHYDCMTILGVTDNRRAPNAPHFKVVGK